MKQALKHRAPDIAHYQRQKSVVAVDRSVELSPLDIPLEEIFLKRIASTIGRHVLDVPNVFPGNRVPMPGRVGEFLDRGTLFHDQYKFYKQFGWFEESQPLVYSSRQVDIRSPWPWNCERPEVFLAQSTDISSDALSDLLVDSNLNLLEKTRLRWDCETGQYSPDVIARLTHVIGLGPALDGIYLPERTLFEVEAAASFLTFAEHRKSLWQGQFGANWISVFSMPLAEICQTELCVTERIFDELFNLTRFCFAPIIVNEYCAVADGNHRFTSAWIWNVLRLCVECEWDLDCTEFHAAVRCAMLKLDLFSSPTTAHEVLFHLGVLLSRRDIATQLESRLKPILRNSSEICEVPVVLVPEYLSGAANKELYDNGTAVLRAHPELYRAIAEAPDLVLPARASYHYTDCVPLPWFDVIQ